MDRNVDTTAVRYGVVVGGLSAFFGVLITILLLISRSNPNVAGGLSLGGCIAFIAILGLLFEAGHITALRVGTISSGTVAGVIAGLLSGMAVGIGPALTTLHSSPSVPFVLGLLFALVFMGSLFAGIGAGLGAFGASVGRARFTKRST